MHAMRIAGTYKSVVGSANCSSCPSYATSPVASSSLANCTCNVGYTGDAGGVCVACPAGTYKAETGISACQGCPAGLVSSLSGMSACQSCSVGNVPANASLCKVCPAGTSSVSGGTTCISDIRAVVIQVTLPFNKTTFAKYEDKYKGGIASIAKVHPSYVEILSVSEVARRRFLRRLFSSPNPSVSVHFQITVESTAVQGTQESFTQDAFTTWADENGVPGGELRVNPPTCGMGRSPDSASLNCIPCERGYYKLLPDNSTCLACPANTFSNQTGATICPGCPSNSSALNGSASCSCNAAFSGPDGGPCTPCPAGTYKDKAGSAGCSDCLSSASSSPAASDNVTDCKCNAGYTGDDGGECTACAAGTYKGEAGSAGCSDCPSSASSSPAASDNVTDCECNAGYTGDDGGECTACAEGTYKDTAGTAECAGCPSSASSSPAASDNVTDCECNAGYTGPNGATCVACVAGKFKTNNGSDACTQCAAGKHSAVTGATSDTCANCGRDTYSSVDNSQCEACPSDSVSAPLSSVETDCKCNAGYTGEDGGECTACTADTYKNTTGSAQCLPCPSDSSSAAGSLNCTCNAGYTGPVTSCTACPAGTYKDVTGASACTPCPVGTQSSQTGRSTLQDCGCPPGYTWSGAECSGCAQGKYKTSTGTEPCSDCPWGSFSPPKSTECSSTCGSTSYQAPKTVFSSSTQENDFDISDEFQPDNDLAGACPSPYTDCLGSREVIVASSAVFPQTPQVGMLWHFGADSSSSYGAWAGIRREDAGSVPVFRVRAGDGRAVPTGSSQIWVDVAEFPQDGEAHEVVVHIGKPSTGKWALRVWIDGEHQATSGEMTASKWTFRGTTNTGHSSYGLAASDSRVATGEPNVDWPGAGDTPSTVKTSLRILSHVSWQSCVSPVLSGTWTTGALSNLSYICCEPCPRNSTSVGNQTGLTSCQCIAGYTGQNGASCSPCAAGSFKEAAGPATCTSCGAGRYSTVVAASSSSVCLACLTGSTTLSNASDSCYCDRGWTGDDPTNCTMCEKGKYKSTVGSTACSLCRANSYSSGGGFDPSCTSCPENSFSPASLQSGAVTDCSCLAGYSGPDGGPCTACPVGKYKSVNGSAASCDFCPPGQYAKPYDASTSCLDCAENRVAPSGATSANDCGCNAGYYGAVDESCMACPVGKFGNSSGGLTEDACFACPVHMTTANQATTSVADCICNDGFTGSFNNGCVACPAGTYKDQEGNSSCTACPPNSTTLSTGSQVQSSCLCKPGFTGPAGGQCTMCEVGTYKNKTGSDSCVNCPSGSHSPEGSADLMACTCQIGHTGNDGQQCALCGYGTYKDSVGSASCTVCPSFSNTTSRGSTEVEDCICDKGYTGSVTINCTACPEGKYKDQQGSGQCTSCPLFSSHLATGATTQMDCLCNKGYNGPPDSNPNIVTCRACPPGTYKDFPGKIGDGEALSPCEACPAHSYSGFGSDDQADCQCNAGFQAGAGGVCTACAAGKYKPQRLYHCIPPGTTCTGAQCPEGYAVDQTPSQNCPLVSHQGLCCSGPPSTPCTQCPENSVSDVGSNASSDCHCMAGYYGLDQGVPTSNNTCLACEPGKYSAVKKSVGCRECTTAKYSPAAASVCLDCPSNSNSPNGTGVVTGCTCNAGFSGNDGGTCTACAAGKYKIAPGESPCVDCPAHTYNPQVSSTSNVSCLGCPFGTTSRAGSPRRGSCKCAAGYYGDLQNDLACGGDCCSECPAGTYRDQIGGVNESDCFHCPLRQHSAPKSVNITDCVCTLFGAPHSKDIQLKRAPKYLQYVLGEFAGRDRPVPFV